MKTLVKTIKTIIAIILIVIGLVIFFTLENMETITSLVMYVVIMLITFIGGIILLTSVNPELTDLFEFEDLHEETYKNYEDELEALREQNLLLIDRYTTLRAILRNYNVINSNNQDRFPNLFNIIHIENLKTDGVRVKETTELELERFKELYD